MSRFLNFCLLALWITLVACDGATRASTARTVGDTANVITSHVADEIVFTLIDTIVVPTLSEETAWFQQLQALEPSSSPNRLWAVDRLSGTFSEITLDGSLVQTLGRKGPGPEELQDPTAMIDDGPRILVLDRAARSISAFTRRGELDFNLPLLDNAWDFALGDDGAVFVVPGSDRLVDVYADGRRIDSMGPPRGSIRCFACEIAVLPEDRLVVTDRMTPRLFLLDREDGAWTVIDLRNDLMSEWQGHSQPGLKSWIDEIVAVTGDRLLLLMSAPGVRKSELWNVDLETGSIIRQILSDSFVTSAVMRDEGIYALLGEFRVSATRGGETVDEGSPAIVRFARE